MRTIVIGGTGHIGTYLTPQFVEAGHQVLCVSRGLREPYHPHPAWADVEHWRMDRVQEEATGAFARRIAEWNPDVVVDLTCFRPQSAQQLVEALRGRLQHFLHCGTIWVHGHSVQVPTTESAPREPFGEYGIQKAAIERYLLNEFRQHQFPATILHPGHIVGPGWNPLNPAGHFHPRVFADLAAGRELLLPNQGMETVHHVHASDVAAAFLAAIQNRETALGESFHVVSGAALTLRGYAERMAQWFGRDANLRFLPWQEWRTTVSDEEAAATWDHIAHSPNCSIAKAQRLLGYAPRYSSLEAVQEAVTWLQSHGALELSPA